MSQTDDLAISVSTLTRRYGYRVALRKVSFDVHTGGIHGLFGNNGAGKSTLMRILSTLLRPHHGSARVFDFDTEEYPIEVRKRIGVIGDKALLYSELTGRENLEFYGKLYSMDREKMVERIEFLSERFQVRKWLDEQTKILSTGLRKRFDIIRSILHDPDLYLLDEPFSGLDKDSAQVFLDYLDEQRKEKTALLTTHNLTLGSEICDDYVTLRKGEILSQGPISEFDGVI